MTEDQQQPSSLKIETTDSSVPLVVHPEILELKLKALKSDLRLMIIASVALNQFLANVSLPTAVTATAIVAAVVAPAAKSVLTLFTRQ